MSSRRILKAAEAIREVVSMAILVELKDPRIQNVTVTFVELSADMRHAKVHVSVMGDEKVQRLSLAGLQNSAGFLQQKISNRLDTRYTPRLTFVLDQGIKNAMAVTRILNEVLPKKTTSDDSDEFEDLDGNDEGFQGDDDQSHQPRSEPQAQARPSGPENPLENGSY